MKRVILLAITASVLVACATKPETDVPTPQAKPTLPEVSLYMLEGHKEPGGLRDRLELANRTCDEVIENAVYGTSVTYAVVVQGLITPLAQGKRESKESCVYAVIGPEAYAPGTLLTSARFE